MSLRGGKQHSLSDTLVRRIGIGEVRRHFLCPREGWFPWSSGRGGALGCQAWGVPGPEDCVMSWVARNGRVPRSPRPGGSLGPQEWGAILAPDIKAALPSGMGFQSVVGVGGPLALRTGGSCMLARMGHIGPREIFLGPLDSEAFIPPRECVFYGLLATHLFMSWLENSGPVSILEQKQSQL